MIRNLAPISRLSSWIGWLILHVGKAGSGRAYGPLSLWFVWQWLTTRYYRSRRVRPGGILKYHIRRHACRVPISLADGTVVYPGDRIVELHFDNAALTARMVAHGNHGREPSRAWLVVRDVAADLAVLAEPGRLDPDVKAVHGRTLLAPASRRLGFEVHPLPHTIWNDLTRFFMLGLLTIYSPAGRGRLALVGRDAYPAEMWIGRRAFVERFNKRLHKD